MIIGLVYKITCLINYKIYVGQTKQLKNKYYLGSGELLLPVIKEFGRKNFIRETICECETMNELDKLENFWIKELHATDPEIGYNISEGGIHYQHCAYPRRTDKPKKLVKKKKEITIEKQTKLSTYTKLISLKSII